LDAKQVIKEYGDPQPLSPGTLASSPFDLFFYHNSPQAQRTINCHHHVDPGFLTVVPCATVPGLNILHKTEQMSIPIETMLEPFKDLVVFSGLALEEISGGFYKGAVHMVEKNAHSRLSLVYELRPKAGTEVRPQVSTKHE